MALPRSRIYIEACPLIDLAKHEAKLALHPTDPGADLARRRDAWYTKQLIDASRDGYIEVFSSFISVAECTSIAQGQPAPPADIQRFYEELLTSGKSGIVSVMLKMAIVEQARDLKWKHGLNLKGMDAIHLASALSQGCSELITTDGRLLNAAARTLLPIKIIRAEQTSLLPPQYQPGLFGHGPPTT